MNHIITHQDPALVKYAAKVLEVDGFGPCKTLAVSDGKQITCIVIYSKFDGYQCEIAIVSIKPTWATRTTIAMLLGYPFQQLGCNRINLVCRADNHKAISLAERLGFIRETKEEGLRAYCPDGTHAHILGMLKSECRWIKEK